MTDRLVRAFPPMTNDWVLGMASVQAFHPAWASAILDHLRSGERAEAQRLIEQSADALHTANSDYFRFDLDGMVGIDEPALITMSPAESTQNMGLGLAPGYSDRKLLALVVLAVDAPSAAIRLDGHEKSVVASPGLLVVVPAYCSLRLECDGDGSVECAAFHAFGRAFR